MDMHARETSSSGPGAHTTSKRLIVGKGLAALLIIAAKGQIVHRALRGSRNTVARQVSQRAKERINQALRGLYIARGYSRSAELRPAIDAFPRVEQGSLWHDYLYRLQ